jgi:hypothetical protein
VMRSSLFDFAHVLFGKPVSTPDQVRGRLFPEHAPAAGRRAARSSQTLADLARAGRGEASNAETAANRTADQPAELRSAVPPLAAENSELLAVRNVHPQQATSAGICVLPQAGRQRQRAGGFECAAGLIEPHKKHAREEDLPCKSTK